MAFDEGATGAGGVIPDWLEYQTSIRQFPSRPATRWLARLCFCISRRRRNRTENALTHRQTNRPDSRRLVSLFRHIQFLELAVLVENSGPHGVRRLMAGAAEGERGA